MHLFGSVIVDPRPSSVPFFCILSCSHLNLYNHFYGDINHMLKFVSTVRSMRIYHRRPSQGLASLSETFHNPCHLGRLQRLGMLVLVQLFWNMHNGAVEGASAQSMERGRIA